MLNYLFLSFDLSLASLAAVQLRSLSRPLDGYAPLHSSPRWFKVCVRGGHRRFGTNFPLEAFIPPPVTTGGGGLMAALFFLSFPSLALASQQTLPLFFRQTKPRCCRSLFYSLKKIPSLGYRIWVAGSLPNADRAYSPGVGALSEI